MTDRTRDGATKLLEMTADGPRLVGSRCRDCGTSTFPRQDGCPRCTSPAVDSALLQPRGTLWTFTVQRFPPVGHDPETFSPFGVGYVELAGEVRVESVLTKADGLVIGMEMELTTHDGAGFAFRPVA
jgi:uncharacterized OB-fold protein